MRREGEGTAKGLIGENCCSTIERRKQPEEGRGELQVLERGPVNAGGWVEDGSKGVEMDCCQGGYFF